MRHFEVSLATLPTLVKVDKNGCWIWQRSTRGKGYAQVTDPYTGRQDYGHRVVWRLVRNGKKIPNGKLIRHKCDVKPCMNPKHIVCSTYSRNNKDTWERNPDRDLRSLSTKLRVTRGALRKAFSKGRAIGGPRGLAAQQRMGISGRHKIG